MIKIQGRLPKQVCIGFSGGVDSVAALDFLSRNHNVTLVFVDHLNKISEQELAHAETTASKYDVQLRKFKIRSKDKNTAQSWEEHWRTERYNIFHSIDAEVVTCHQLDDCVETWVWSSLNGTGKIIPYRNRNVIRPFRLNRKSEFIGWCERKGATWFEDPTNCESNFIRNFIRNELMEKLLVVNPGLHKTIAKKVSLDI